MTFLEQHQLDTDPLPQSDTQPETDNNAAFSAAKANDPTEEEIAAEAFARYVSRGGAHGYAVEDWLQAECALRQRRATGSSQE